MSGFVLASSRGLQNVILETDSLQIATALSAGSLNMSFVGPLVENFKFLLSTITGRYSTHVSEWHRPPSSAVRSELRQLFYLA
ncbi:hypothetical protein C1H46_019242 [Malus baccata]|uniref:RNase H type-1 domain-containing protein n=1 Tax=Malus baccata TaxID=106549 RepID=A0A540M8U8_MALBA|nr:hypothetical protein C1H46_019242 [Malus baccata]